MKSLKEKAMERLNTKTGKMKGFVQFIKESRKNDNTTETLKCLN